MHGTSSGDLGVLHVGSCSFTLVRVGYVRLNSRGGRLSKMPSELIQDDPVVGRENLLLFGLRDDVVVVREKRANDA
jgi:hypothetical protein